MAGNRPISILNLTLAQPFAVAGGQKTEVGQTRFGAIDLLGIFSMHPLCILSAVNWSLSEIFFDKDRGGREITSAKLILWHPGNCGFPKISARVNLPMLKRRSFCLHDDVVHDVSPCCHLNLCSSYSCMSVYFPRAAVMFIHFAILG